MIENCTDSAKPASRLPGHIRRQVEREIEEAIHPKGMSVHDGRTRIHSSHAGYLLRVIDELEREAAERTEHVRPSSDDARDAARYRWLRGNHDLEGICEHMYLSGPDLDAAIDEALGDQPYISSTPEAKS